MVSVEEENYVRMSLILTGISPRAVRTKFDYEFAPAFLDASLKKEYEKLFNMKKERRINQSQWNLLFPRFPDVPDSKTFDVTLMTTILRNLTPMNPPTCGFDCLPSAMETTPSADLARIKYYRNYLAHLDDCKIDFTFFNTAWNDISSSIERLGGQQMKMECDYMKTKPLDQTNREIMMDMQHSNNEIRELKESYQSLKLSHAAMKISHELLQDNHAVMTKEMQEINISHKDTVPWNIRGKLLEVTKLDIMIHSKPGKKMIKRKLFIETKAAMYVLKCIQENSCVTITASSGVGKTSILRHTALQMAKEGYDVLLVTEPRDIWTFSNPETKNLFVVDDLCGNFSVDQYDIKTWEPQMKKIEQILNSQQTKLLTACRLQVYQDEKFESLSVFKSCVCNILSKHICLSKTEKQSIAKLYLKSKASEIGDYHDLYDCFPLLCKLYYDNPELNITDFFMNPFSVYEAELDKLLRKGYHTKYCALALCVVFNNMLNEELFTDDVNEGTQIIIENTCVACKLDKGTSRLVLQNELELLTHTYIKKERNVYKAIHDKMFDFLSYYFAQKIMHCLIKNADNDLIKERFLLERKDDMDQFITIIPLKYHYLYIQRMIDDWSKGKIKVVFENTNMKLPDFRQKFHSYLNTLNMSYQKQLANITDNYNLCTIPLSNKTEDDDVTFDTPLLHCCYIGDVSLVEWCCNHCIEVNRCTYNGESPIAIGCEQGHTKVVKVLLDRGMNINECDWRGQSPLLKACENGYIEIVKLLLDRGAVINIDDNRMVSTFLTVCSRGHTEIVKILLDIGANCNRYDEYEQFPIMKACEHCKIDTLKLLLDKGADHGVCDCLGQSLVKVACELGHTKIVRILLDKGVDCRTLCTLVRLGPLTFNIGNQDERSLVMVVCEQGHTEILKMLLDSGLDCDTCDRWDNSPLMIACGRGDTEIVNMLLDRGADYYKCNRIGETTLTLACECGHTEIVHGLLDRGADFDKRVSKGELPLTLACENGHIEIVKMLLERGVDCNQCDLWGHSPFMKAHRYGHIQIIKMLIDKGADYRKCNIRGQLTLTVACELGHPKIIKILLDRGADFNECYSGEKSPLMLACEYGRTEIVKMLLDGGADCNRCVILGQTPLTVAYEKGHTEIVKMLLGKGADCNTCVILGQPPLTLACEKGHTEIVKMMLDRGADFNKCESGSQLPFIVAFQQGHTEIGKMLLDKGADYKCGCNRKSSETTTCLQMYSCQF